MDKTSKYLYIYIYIHCMYCDSYYYNKKKAEDGYNRVINLFFF